MPATGSRIELSRPTLNASGINFLISCKGDRSSTAFTTAGVTPASERRCRNVPYPVRRPGTICKPSLLCVAVCGDGVGVGVAQEDKMIATIKMAARFMSRFLIVDFDVYMRLRAIRVIIAEAHRDVGCARSRLEQCIDQRLHLAVFVQAECLVSFAQSQYAVKMTNDAAHLSELAPVLNFAHRSVSFSMGIIGACSPSRCRATIFCAA